MRMDNSQDLRKWRFWPVLMLAFMYPVNNALVNIAIPIYFFQIHLDLIYIGVLAAGSAMAYSFSPILFNRLADRIGRKRSIALAMLGVSLAQTTYFFSLNPMIFLIARMAEGLMMGFYWPSLQSSISDNALHDHSMMMSRYNIFWNSGLLAGYVIGASFLFMVDVIEIIFYISPIFIYANFFIALIFFKESQKITLESTQGIQENGNEKHKERTDISLTKFYIPVLVPIIFATVFSIVKASVNFLYPIESEMLGFPSFTVYLQVFFTICAQLIGTSIATFFSIKNLKRVPIICIIIMGFTVLVYGLTSDFYVFIILFFLMGFFCGLLYGFALKLSMALNMKGNTSRYSGILESVIGTCFLIFPITCGFLAGFGMGLAFYIISIIVFLFLIPCIWYVRKME